MECKEERKYHKQSQIDVIDQIMYIQKLFLSEI